MVDDFKRALARVQSDYSFYIDCQANPAVALASYDLTPEERSALTNPDKLAAALRREIEVNRLPSITIKIKGTHDWVNPRPKTTRMAEVSIATEVEAIRKAGTDGERSAAAFRLMEQIG